MATPEIIKDIKLDNSETDSDDMTTDNNIADQLKLSWIYSEASTNYIQKKYWLEFVKIYLIFMKEFTGNKVTGVNSHNIKYTN